MNIYIKGSFTPVGDVKITVENPQGEAITYQGNVIELSRESGVITAVRQQQITAEEHSYVQDKYKKLPRNELFEGYLASQYKSVQTILGYIQVFDGVFRLDTELRMQSTYEWSEDHSTWAPIPDKRETSWCGADLRQTLAAGFMGNIGRISNAGIPVFQAFNHLYKAYDDFNTRFKWINGTIAAEHAFKEFLNLLDPRTESLMLYVPSPPIERLYKDVLISYTGKMSSMYSELQKGAAKRNELIHRPATPSPDLKKTNGSVKQTVSILNSESKISSRWEGMFFLIPLGQGSTAAKNIGCQRDPLISSV